MRIFITSVLVFLCLNAKSQEIEWMNLGDSLSQNFETIITSDDVIITSRYENGVLNFHSVDLTGSEITHGALMPGIYYPFRYLFEGISNDVIIITLNGKVYSVSLDSYTVTEIADVAESYEHFNILDVVKIDSRIIYSGSAGEVGQLQLLRGEIDLASLEFSNNLSTSNVFSGGLATNEENDLIAEIRFSNNSHSLAISDNFNNIISNNNISQILSNIIVHDIHFYKEDILILGEKNYSQPEFKTTSILFSFNQFGNLNIMKEFEPSETENYLSLSSIEVYDEFIYLGGTKGENIDSDIYLITINEDFNTIYDIQKKLSSRSDFVHEIDVSKDGKVIISGNYNILNSVAQSKAFTFLIGDNISNWTEYNYKSLEIFPNPVNSFLQITDWQEFRNGKIRIIDLNGRSIRDFKLSSKLIDVSELPSGSYVISIADENAIYMSKFIKL